MKAIILMGLLAATALGQPKITAIVSSADFKGDVAILGLGTIFGTNLATGEQAAVSLPLPLKLANAELFSCPFSYSTIDQCSALPLLYVGPDQINFFAGVNGEVRLRNDGVVTDFGRGGWASYAPIIFKMGWDCSFDPADKDSSPCGLSATQRSSKQVPRGAITDIAGSLITSMNPMRVNRDYSIWLTGLGGFALATSPLKYRITVWVDQIPVFGYPGATSLPAPISYAGMSPYPGLNQINFRLPDYMLGGHPDGYPPLSPCADYKLELGVYVLIQGDSFRLNYPNIPVLIRNGDVPCTT